MSTVSRFRCPRPTLTDASTHPCPLRRRRLMCASLRRSRSSIRVTIARVRSRADGVFWTSRRRLVALVSHSDRVSRCLRAPQRWCEDGLFDYRIALTCARIIVRSRRRAAREVVPRIERARKSLDPLTTRRGARREHRDCARHCCGRCAVVPKRATSRARVSTTVTM